MANFMSKKRAYAPTDTQEDSAEEKERKFKSLKSGYLAHVTVQVGDKLSAMLAKLGDDINKIQTEEVKKFNGIKTGFFNKNKVLPESLTPLPEEKLAEYKTANYMLHNLLSPVSRGNVPQSEIVNRLNEKVALLEMDIKRLKKGERLDKSWNQWMHMKSGKEAIFSDLGPEDVAEKKLLGRITDPKIIKELAKVPAALSSLIKQFQIFIDARRDAIFNAINLQVAEYYESIKSTPLGRFVKDFAKAQGVKNEGSALYDSEEGYEKYLAKVEAAAEASKAKLSGTDLEKAELVEKAGYRRGDIEFIAITSTQKQYDNFIAQLKDRLNNALQIPTNAVDQYRRATLD